MKEPAKACTPAARRRAVQRVVGKTREEAADRDASLEPCEVQSRARMDAEAECEVAIRRARDVESIGVGKLRGIAIRRADAQRHPRMPGQLCAAYRARRGRDPVAELIGAFEAQEFLHGRMDQRGTGDEPRALARP